ncbi:hypothetical protein SSP24_73830 [Streptomyces spinoverrucosus]|uniref:Uncharacterized protein n=1 Tax=Streptomyces spinoverrucosus TaxID=284043 RepID=A0A4Y3VU20_9ACTN|nr:hypothetical protein SSP24_73830 [Streptomyces spinoverrucosus]GHB81753.1 hypothetical protein GCM10010397_61120 [Streptomyces spinoverrucosus]
MPQAREARLGRYVQDIEAGAHRQVERGARHGRPAQFVLVPPPDPIARIKGGPWERDRGHRANHAKRNRQNGVRVTLGVPADA